MFRDAIYTSTSPSLEATMQFGQFGCSSITCTEDAVSIRVRPAEDVRRKSGAPKPHAAGFAAFLYGRTQCTD